MKLIPAISIKHGRVAMAKDGQYVYQRDKHGEFLNPVSLVKELKPSYEEIFILDIDGMERNNPDLDTVKRMAAFKDVWLDAGTKDADSMMDIFVSDASMAVMGTVCMRSLDELRKSLEISDRVIFSIGYDGGIVSPDSRMSGAGLGRLSALLKDVPNLRTGLFFDLGGIRDRRGIDVTMLSEISPLFEEFFVSGHVAEAEHEALEKAGVRGIITDFRRLGEMLND